MLLLVDGDVLVFRAGFACEKTKWQVRTNDVLVECVNKKHADKVLSSIEEEGGVASLESYVDLEPFENAAYVFRSMVERAQKAVGADEVVVVFSGPSKDNFRHDVATLRGYKANRDKSHRPTHEHALKDWAATQWERWLSVGEEADDVLGVAQWNEFDGSLTSYETCICTNDKDLLMIPGLHYNPTTENSPSRYVDLEEANHRFWVQLLTGDSTDNIQGVPGIGPAKAEKAYEGCRTWQDYWAAATALYVQGYGEEDAGEALLENGRLVWIRRQADELWEPELMEEYDG